MDGRKGPERMGNVGRIGLADFGRRVGRAASGAVCTATADRHDESFVRFTT